MDGSTDETIEQLRQLERTLPKLNVVTLFKNQGVGYARRIGVACTPVGCIVVEVDDHDLLDPQALKRLEICFDNPGVQFAYGLFDHVSEEGVRSAGKGKPSYSAGLFRRSRCWCEGIRAYRRSLYWAVGGHYPSRSPAVDYDLALRMEDALGCTGIVCIQERLGWIRDSACSISGQLGDVRDRAANKWRSLTAQSVFDPWSVCNSVQ